MSKPFKSSAPAAPSAGNLHNKKESQMTPNIDKIVEHYNHAREKHPYFADKLVWEINDTTLNGVMRNRERIQTMLKMQKEESSVSAETLLMLEVNKYEEEVVKNNTPAAVEEVYDCITVLLRIIDVLEERQALGKPEEVTND